jgi:hypothetical protein
MLGEGRPDIRTLARKTFDRRLGGSPFRRDLIFRGASRQLFEGKLQLIDETGAALRLGPIELPLQLGDDQLLMRDESLVVGLDGAGDGILSPSLQQRCFQRINVIGEVARP